MKAVAFAVLLSLATCQAIYIRLGARNLPGADVMSGKSDPFAQLYVDGARIGKTVTLDNNHNPDWSETFFIKSGKDLVVEIRDEDRVNPDDSLGRAYIPIGDLEKMANGASQTYTLFWKRNLKVTPSLIVTKVDMASKPCDVHNHHCTQQIGM